MSLEFLKQNTGPMSIDEARRLVQIYFTRKKKYMCRRYNAWHLKHAFERMSRVVCDDYRYCATDTAIDAFRQEGFDVEQCGERVYFNVDPNNLKSIYRKFYD